MEATIKLNDQKAFEALVQFLRSLNIEVVTKKQGQVNDYIKAKKDLDDIALYSAREIFENLGSDEDYEEWINAPEIA